VIHQNLHVPPRLEIYEFEIWRGGGGEYYREPQQINRQANRECGALPQHDQMGRRSLLLQV